MAVVGDACDRLAGAYRAGKQAPDSSHAAVVVVVQSCDQHLQGAVHVYDRRRHRGKNGVEEGLQIGTTFRRVACPAFSGDGVDNREIGLLLAGPQLHEEIERVVQHAVGIGVAAIYLVDDDDDPRPIASAFSTKCGCGSKAPKG